jgi:Trypsin-co-occurring domain 1
MTIAAYVGQGDEWPIAIDLGDVDLDPGQIERTLGPFQNTRDRLAKLPEDLFDEGLRLVRSCARRTSAAMGAMMVDEAPDEVELQISVKLDAEFGAYITKASAATELQVVLRWKRAVKPEAAGIPAQAAQTPAPGLTTGSATTPVPEEATA